MFRLLDLCFADDVRSFANTKEDAQNVLESLVLRLAAAGSMLNTSGSHMMKYLAIPNRTNCLAASCALRLVRIPMWNASLPKKINSQGFPETPLDVTMQRVFDQTSVALFRSNCFFNSLLRCRAPAFIQKIFTKIWCYVENLFDLGRHIPGNLKQRGCVELHHRRTIAWAKFNKHRTILTNKHVSLKLRLKFFNAVVTPAMLFSLHTLALTKVQLENINVLQRKMLRSIVGWVRVNGEDWSETMRRMNHRLSVALELFPIPTWTEQLAKRQFQFAAKIASEQSWSSIAGHWICTTGWQANFDNMPSRKRGRPLVKWDDKLSHLTHQLFPLHNRWLVAAKFPFWQNARQFFVSHFVDL